MRRLAVIASLFVVVAIAAVAVSFAGVSPAEAHVALAGTTTLAMAANAGISDEAQHLLNSLEAHFEAVRRAVASGSDALIAHVEKAWEDVLAAIEGVEFSGKTDAGAGETAGTAVTTSKAA